MIKYEDWNFIEREETKKGTLERTCTGYIRTTPIKWWDSGGGYDATHIIFSLGEDTWTYCSFKNFRSILLFGYSSNTQFILNKKPFTIDQGEFEYLDDFKEPHLFLFKAGVYQIICLTGTYLHEKFDHLKRNLLYNIREEIKLRTDFY